MRWPRADQRTPRRRHQRRLTSPTLPSRGARKVKRLMDTLSELEQRAADARSMLTPDLASLKARYGTAYEVKEPLRGAGWAM